MIKIRIKGELLKINFVIECYNNKVILLNMNFMLLLGVIFKVLYYIFVVSISYSRLWFFDFYMIVFIYFFCGIIFCGVFLCLV